MIRRIIIVTLLILSLLMPLTLGAVSTAGAFTITDLVPFVQTMGYVPRTANNIGTKLDRQIMRLLEPSGYGRETVSIACMVPVYLGDLKATSPLARQMSEELSRFFMEKGYRVDEIRKGNEVVMVPDRGEFLLSRDTSKLHDRNVNTELVLTGTYTITDKSVRFNMRLLHTPTQETIAQSAGTVPITDELAPLVADNDAPPPALQPSVRTRLNNSRF